MALHQALKLMRIYHDLKQADVAKKLDVAKSYVSEIEAGNRTPSMKVLEQYAEIFGVPLSSILFFSENLNDPMVIRNSKTFISSKILRLLDFIAEKAENNE